MTRARSSRVRGGGLLDRGPPRSDGEEDHQAKTVESHIFAVLRKLQLSSRYELTRWASDRGLV